MKEDATHMITKFTQGLVMMTLISSPAMAQTTLSTAERVQILNEISPMIEGQDYTGAISAADRVIASYTDEFAEFGEPNQCVHQASSFAAMAKLFKNGGQKAPDGRPLKFVSGEFCAAQYLKGYALVRAGKATEAGAHLERAATLDPVDPLYMTIYAEWLNENENWARAAELFDKAETNLDYAPAEHKKSLQSRIFEGRGIALARSGNLIGAEKSLKRALKANPANDVVKAELENIRILRKSAEKN